MSKILKSADLYYSDPSVNSDKEYHIQLVIDYSVYHVNCQWGRKGSTLQTQTKKTVTIEKAENLFKKVVDEKMGKGYKEISVDTTWGLSTYVTSVVPTGVSKGDYGSGGPEKADGLVPCVGKRKMLLDIEEKILPQLLNPINESEVEKYLKDDAWGAQEKKDGRHQILRRRGDVVTAFNKKGKEIGYPKVWEDDLQAIPMTLDGEAIGEVFHAFDILEAGFDTADYRGLGYGARWEKLVSRRAILGPSIKIVPLAIGYEAKKALYDQLLKDGKEGIVFKKLDSEYKPGRPASGGSMVKFKFYSEASVRVCKGREGKHSIGMEILDGKKWVFIGNCTIGQSTDLPPIGSVCEIRYLYVAGKGGCLYQPTFKEPRDDVDESECVIGQLKYKAEEE